METNDEEYFFLVEKTQFLVEIAKEDEHTQIISKLLGRHINKFCWLDLLFRAQFFSKMACDFSNTLKIIQLC